MLFAHISNGWKFDEFVVTINRVFCTPLVNDQRALSLLEFCSIGVLGYGDQHELSADHPNKKWVIDF